MPVSALRSFAEQLGRSLQLDGGFSVALVNDRTMKRYHAQFAAKNRTTDVLSFPFQEPDSVEGYLGDILISVEMANRQQESGLGKELRILLLHGLLHLLGYDHKTDNGEMTRLEKRLRKEFQLA